MTVSLAVLTTDPIVPYAPVPVDPAIVAEYAGSPLTSRASELDRALMSYPLRFRGIEAKRLALLAFWRARRGPVGLFYFRDRLDYTRTGIVPTGLVNGSNTVFTIPVGDPYGGDFPIDDANAVLTVNGTPVSKTVGTDERTFTAAVAPAGGTTVLLAYTYYRKVRFLGDRFPLTNPAVGTFEVALDLMEEVA